MEKLTCKNCGEEFKGNYCWNCGQKRIDDINWSFIIHSIGDAFEFKKGFFYNFKNFSLYPIRSISEYLNGKTKSFLNPISYMFIGLSLLFLSIQIIGMIGKTGIDESLFKEAEKIIYIGTISFPFFFSLILLFSIIDKKPNYLKGIIVSFFISGHVLIIFTIARLLFFSINQVVSVDFNVGLYFFVLAGIYFSITLSKGFLKINYPVLVLRLIGSTIITLVIFFFILAILLNIGVISRPDDNEAYEFGRGIGRAIKFLFIGI